MPPKTQAMPRPSLTEKQIQTAVMNEMRRVGWLTIRLNSAAFNVGDRYVRGYTVQGINASAGVCDVLGFKGERAILFEIKKHDGKLSPSQKRFIEYAGEHGVTVYVVRSADEARGVLVALETASTCRE